MTGPRIPARLDAALRRVLEAELARGNVIDQVADWPPACELLVILRHPFAADYPVGASVAFTVSDSLAGSA